MRRVMGAPTYRERQPASRTCCTLRNWRTLHRVDSPRRTARPKYAHTVPRGIGNGTSRTRGRSERAWSWRHRFRRVYGLGMGPLHQRHHGLFRRKAFRVPDPVREQFIQRTVKLYVSRFVLFWCHPSASFLALACPVGCSRSRIYRRAVWWRVSPSYLFPTDSKSSW